MQSKYHVYKKSFIRKWKQDNERLLCADIFNSPFIIVQDSNENDFFLDYIADDNRKYALDWIEKALNSKCGPEQIIEQIFKEYENSDFGQYELDKTNLSVLNFWSNRWNSIVDTHYVSVIKSDSKERQIIKQIDNVDRVISLQVKDIVKFKFGSVGDDEVLKTFADSEYSLDKKFDWKIDNSYKLIIIHHKEYIPLCMNPVQLMWLKKDQFFLMQLSPNLTICAAPVLFIKDKDCSSLPYYLLFSEKNYKMYFNSTYFNEQFTSDLNFWYEKNEKHVELFYALANKKDIMKFLFESIYIIKNYVNLSERYSSNSKWILTVIDKSRRTCLIQKSMVLRLINIINDNFSKQEIMNFFGKKYTNHDGSPISKNQLEKYFRKLPFHK